METNTFTHKQKHINLEMSGVRTVRQMTESHNNQQFKHAHTHTHTFH